MEPLVKINQKHKNGKHQFPSTYRIKRLGFLYGYVQNPKAAKWPFFGLSSGEVWSILIACSIMVLHIGSILKAFSIMVFVGSILNACSPMVLFIGDHRTEDLRQNTVGTPVPSNRLRASKNLNSNIFINFFLIHHIINEISVSEIIAFQNRGEAPNFGCSLTGACLV